MALTPMPTVMKANLIESRFYDGLVLNQPHYNKLDYFIVENKIFFNNKTVQAMSKATLVHARNPNLEG